MTNRIALKYKWRKTWPDKENDFVGRDPDTPDHVGNPSTIGRFYLMRTPDGERWSWYMQWGGNERVQVNTSGLAMTAREAAKKIEESYDRLRELTVPQTSS